MLFRKDPQATLDYVCDWGAYLGEDTIATSQWTVPDGITQAAATNTTKTATIWLAGGTVGSQYEVVNRITTTAGRTDDRTIKIQVVNR